MGGKDQYNSSAGRPDVLLEVDLRTDGFSAGQMINAAGRVVRLVRCTCVVTVRRRIGRCRCY